MKKLTLKTQNSGGFVELPVEFIDSYLAEAGGTALKVYLYLLRCAKDPSAVGLSAMWWKSSGSSGFSVSQS